MGYLSTALVNVTFKRKRRKPKQNKITHRCQNYQCHRLHYHCLQRKENRKGNKNINIDRTKLSISNWKNTVCSKQQLKVTQDVEIIKKTCETDQKLTENGRRNWKKDGDECNLLNTDPRRQIRLGVPNLLFAMWCKKWNVKCLQFGHIWGSTWITKVVLAITKCKERKVHLKYKDCEYFFWPYLSSQLPHQSLPGRQVLGSWAPDTGCCLLSSP